MLSCARCANKFGYSHCEKCRFVDLIGPDGHPYFHCEQCGCCYIGVKSMAYHCKLCNTCIFQYKQSTHVCLKPEQTCPICLDLVARVGLDYRALPCGHYVHTQCIVQMWKEQNYRCPICRKICIEGYERRNLIEQ